MAKCPKEQKEIFEYITCGYGSYWKNGITIQTMFMATVPRTAKTELHKFINACKSASSRLLKLLSAPCRRGAD